MEARLLHARKVPNNNGTLGWQIMNPHRRGIALPANVPKSGLDDIFKIDPDVMIFLVDLLGKGGPWEDWTLQAIGHLRTIKDDRSNTLYFDVVFVRDIVQGNMTPLSSGSDGGFEIMKAEQSPGS